MQNGHDVMEKPPELKPEEIINASMRLLHEKAQTFYKATLHWMANTKVKHDALDLAMRIIREQRKPTGQELAQLKAAANLKMRVEGEEMWLARTIMLTEVLDTYLRLMATEDVAPEELQRAFDAVKERHFVFMPAQEVPDDGQTGNG